MISLSNMRSVFARFDAPVPPAAPDDDESMGDLSPDDDTDCAAEGITQPEPPPATMPKETEDVLTWRVGVVRRLRKLERAIEDVNDHLQVHRNALAELERQGRKTQQQIEALHALLHAEVRAIDATREVA